MRLPTDVRTRFLTRFCALGLTAMLAGCGAFGGGDLRQVASTDVRTSSDMAGPSADYPVVVGEPYEIAGKVYTPLDTMNYDEVGYAVGDVANGGGVTVSHRTLPLPSYVEITSLDTGKTILARVERRGPMSGNGVVALSRGAQAQLSIAQGAPVRVRRVNPIEADRAQLRTGQMAPLRMETPKSLLTVLKRKLSSEGAVSLASEKQVNPASTQTAPMTAAKELPALVQPSTRPTAPVVAARTAPKPQQSFDNAFSTQRKVVTAYPLAPLNGSARPAPVRAATPPVTTASTTTITTRATPTVVDAVRVQSSRIAASPRPKADGNYVIQAAAFSSKANAEKAANSIDGFIQQSGKYYRVRMGPFVSRGQAEAALAKVRAAGYRDAKVFTAG